MEAPAAESHTATLTARAQLVRLSPSCASRRASSQVTPKCRDVWVLHQAKDLTSHQHSGMKTPPGATIFFSSVYYQLVCV